MKKLLTILLLLPLIGFGCEQVDLSTEIEQENIGAKQLTKIEKVTTLKDKIANEQNNLKNPKYKYIKKKTDTETGLDYEVHEYETPKGEIGYQVYFYDEQGRVIESIGYGIEAESRTFTIDYPVITPTST